MRSATIMALFWATVIMIAAMANVEAQNAAMPTVEQREYGEWKYNHSEDRFSDDELWITMTMDQSSNREHALSFLCYSTGEERVALKLGFLGLATDLETKNVEWVIDDREPRSHHFLVVSSGVEGTMLAAETDAFVDAVRDGRMMYVRVEKYNGAHESYSFSLDGVSAALGATPCAFDG